MNRFSPRSNSFSSVMVVGLFLCLALSSFAETGKPVLSTTSNTGATKPSVHIDPRLDQRRIQQWLDWQQHTLRLATGELPAKPFKVRVRATNTRFTENASEIYRGALKSVVPWGQVKRFSERNLVELVVNPAASLQQLKTDWTAYHEYSHLLIPYRGYGDLWFSEGLASYYQNVIQYRVGNLSAEQARDKLIAGLKRGIQSNPAPELSLARLSQNMPRYGAYMRVYWSGAWYFFQVDQLLREQGQTLDQTLLLLNQCCSHKSMSAEDMVLRMDQISDSQIFSANFYRVRASSQLTISDDKLSQLQTMTWPRKLADSNTYLSTSP